VYQSIHYLHGLIEEGKIPYEDTIVLSRDEFKTAYSNNSNLMNLLVPTFENDPIVFIGCRLQEPVMPQVFSVCKQHQEKRQRAMMDCGRQVSNPPPKYILLPKPEVTNLNGEIDLKQSQIRLEEEEDYYKEMDIISVWYRATGGDHSLLRLALENLARFPPISPHHGW
jgi:hypothetical protein